MQHDADQLLQMLTTKASSKSPKELSGLIKLLFASPHSLLARIKQITTTNQTSNSQSHLDITAISKLYQCIQVSGKDNQLMLCFNKAFDQFSNEGSLKAFLKSAQEMKYFLVVILWDRLFTQEQNKLTLMRALQLIKNAAYYHKIFVSWLKDLSPEQLKLQVKSLNLHLKSLCLGLEAPFEQINKTTSEQTRVICEYMKLLYCSNKQKKRIPLQAFNNNDLAQIFQPVEQFKLYLRGAVDLNFISYPFLLDFQYKYKLIQIESLYEHRVNMKKSIQKGLSSIIQDMDIHGGGFSLENVLHLCFAVNRNDILNDSMDKLGKIKANLKNPLKIQFIGQQGADQGGVKNEYFQLLTKAILNPYMDMFVPRNQGRFNWFNGYSYEAPIRFQFVGMLLGLSIYNSVHLDIHFPQIVYKKLMLDHYQEDINVYMIQDLQQIQPDVYRSLKDILLTEESLHQLEMFFNIQLEYFGEKIVYQLVQDGNFIRVDRDNRQHYCMLYADYFLNKNIQKQFIPFKKGFSKVVSGAIIHTFEPEELRMLISGNEHIDMKQLQQSARYEGGYTLNTPIIKHLWDILTTLNQKQCKEFLSFVTGTDRVPIQGLKSLNFLIQRHSNTSHLPTAHTCFNVLLLPEYQSKLILGKNIKLILEHNQGFGLI